MGAPGEPARIDHLGEIRWQRRGRAERQGRHMLGQGWRPGEASRPQAGQQEQALRPRGAGQRQAIGGRGACRRATRKGVRRQPLGEVGADGGQGLQIARMVAGAQLDPDIAPIMRRAEQEALAGGNDIAAAGRGGRRLGGGGDPARLPPNRQEFDRDAGALRQPRGRLAGREDHGLGLGEDPAGGVRQPPDTVRPF